MLIKRIVTALVIAAALGVSVASAKTAPQSAPHVPVTAGADDFGINGK